MDSFNTALYSDKIRKEFINFEPKRLHRFKVDFPHVKDFTIQKIDKPKLVNGKWSDIKIELIDLVGPSTSQIVFGLTNPLNYTIVFDKRSLLDKILGKPIFTITIYGLDPIGVEIEKWSIEIKRVKLINFGEYDYSNDGISTISLILEVKKCTLNY